MAAVTSLPPRPKLCAASSSKPPAARDVRSGGDRDRVDLDGLAVAAPEPSDNLLALDEALAQLAATDPKAAELVKLRYFAGLTVPQAAAALGIAPRTADFLWAYAKSWLLQRIETNRTQ